LNEHRRKGIALALAQKQEKWAKQQGYDSVTFKTLNRHKNMLCFALRRDFYLFKIDIHDDILEYRLWLKKEL